MKKIAIGFLFNSVVCFFSFAQNVGIGTTTPNASAALDVSSGNKGFLPPRMTFNQIKLIPNPSPGLVVYDVQFKCLRLFDGTEWQCLQQTDKDLKGPPGDLAVWNNSSDGTNNAIRVKVDNNGNIYVIGYYLGVVSFGAFNFSSLSGDDIFLVKYNETGAVEWAKTFGGSAADQGTGLALDASGNIYIAGYFSSPVITVGSFVLTNAGAGADLFVAKYDPAGTAIWAISNGGTGSDFVYDLTVDASGNAYITGTCNSSTFIFGPSLVLGDGVDYNIIIAKYNSLGVAQWARTAGGPAVERGQSITVDAAGNSYITGYFESNICSFGGLAIVVNTGGRDVYIASYDASGNANWARSVTGSADEWSFGIVNDGNGNIYFTGYFKSGAVGFGTFNLSNYSVGTADIFIAKYDAGGTPIWAKKAGGTADDNAYGIAIDGAGNIYLTGYFSSTVADFDGYILNNNSTTWDVFMVKYNSFGSSVWVKSGGGLSTDYGFAIATNSTANRIAAVGRYVAKAKFGNTLLKNGNYFLWVYGE